MNSSLVGIDSLKSWKYIHTSYEIEFLFSYNFFLSCSVTQSLLTLFNPMDCSTPGFLVLHYLPEFAQIHVHWVGDAIQPSHPLSPLSLPAFNLSQHQGLFQWVGCSHQVAKVLELQLQHSPSNEYSGLIFFRSDWFDLLVSIISVSQFGYLLFLLLQISMARIHDTILNRNDGSEHICLFLILAGKAFRLSTWSMVLIVGLLNISFIRWSKFPCISSLRFFKSWKKKF